MGVPLGAKTGCIGGPAGALIGGICMGIWIFSIMNIKYNEKGGKS